MEKSIGPLFEQAPVHRWQVESTKIGKTQWDIIHGSVTLKVLATIHDPHGGVSYEYVGLQMDESHARELILALAKHRENARSAELPCTEFQREDWVRDEHQFENGRCAKCGQLV